jgi:hypothetical protein
MIEKLKHDRCKSKGTDQTTQVGRRVARSTRRLSVRCCTITEMQMFTVTTTTPTGYTKTRPMTLDDAISAARKYGAIVTAEGPYTFDIKGHEGDDKYSVAIDYA